MLVTAQRKPSLCCCVDFLYLPLLIQSPLLSAPCSSSLAFMDHINGAYSFGLAAGRKQTVRSTDRKPKAGGRRKRSGYLLPILSLPGSSGVPLHSRPQPLPGSPLLQQSFPDSSSSSSSSPLEPGSGRDWLLVTVSPGASSKPLIGFSSSYPHPGKEFLDWTLHNGCT